MSEGCRGTEDEHEWEEGHLPTRKRLLFRNRLSIVDKDGKHGKERTYGQRTASIDQRNQQGRNGCSQPYVENIRWEQEDRNDWHEEHPTKAMRVHGHSSQSQRRLQEQPRRKGKMR